MGLSRAVIDLNAFEDAGNDPANDLECSPISHCVEAELRARSQLHLDEHYGLVGLLKLEDRCYTAFPVKNISLDDICNVFEAKIHLKIFSFHIVWHEDPEILMSVLHLLDLSTLFAQ